VERGGKTESAHLGSTKNRIRGPEARKEVNSVCKQNAGGRGERDLIEPKDILRKGSKDKLPWGLCRLAKEAGRVFQRV